MRIKFDKINGFIRVFDEIRYLVLFRAEKYGFIYNRTIGIKSDVTYLFFIIIQKSKMIHTILGSKIKHWLYIMLYNAH